MLTGTGIFGLGVLVICVVIGFSLFVLAGYFLMSAATMRVLRICSYPYLWMAWVPLVRYWALADIAACRQPSITVQSLSVPTMAFQLWWIGGLLAGEIPNVGFLLALAIQIFCMGTVYANIYSRIEGLSVEECNVIGYLSGWIPLIAIVKFLSYSKHIRM